MLCCVCCLRLEFRNWLLWGWVGLRVEWVECENIKYQVGVHLAISSMKSCLNLLIISSMSPLPK